MTDLETLSLRLLDAARAAGADAADVIAEAGDSLSIEVRNGALEQAERAEGIDVGLRVLVGRRQASVGSSDVRPETLAAMAERAVAMAREAPEDPWCGLADPSELAHDFSVASLELADPAPAPTPASLQAAALEAEAAALAVRGVTRMDGAGASWGATRAHLAASNGFSAGYGMTVHSLQAVAICGEGTGMERDYAWDSRIHAADMDDAASIGRLAGERSVAMAGASKPPTGAWPVIYDERVASGLIGHLVQAINGMAIARGASWIKDGLGEPVLPKGIDLVEDPHRARSMGSRIWDVEGLPTRRIAWVEDGVLTGWVLDLSTGRQLGMKSTASAARASGAPPAPTVGNLALTPGAASRAELMAEMGTGLLVTSLIGASINPTTGDYSRGASGFWVENGEIVRPVNECTIAGNLRQMLASLRPANDGRPHLTRVVPSLLVEGLVIAGA